MIPKKSFSEAISDDLSIIVEVLRTNNSFPFMVRPREFNVNKMLVAGWYSIGMDQYNLPSDAYPYGNLMVFGENKIGARLTQLFISESGAMYIRSKTLSQVIEEMNNSWHKVKYDT